MRVSNQSPLTDQQAAVKLLTSFRSRLAPDEHVLLVGKQLKRAQINAPVKLVLGILISSALLIFCSTAVILACPIPSVINSVIPFFGAGTELLTALPLAALIAVILSIMAKRNAEKSPVLFFLTSKSLYKIEGGQCQLLEIREHIKKIETQNDATTLFMEAGGVVKLSIIQGISLELL
ncbi:MAG: hypothetical protein EKK48_15100 [Candidatus Melainabacteria bacterium]|nr:MAG: hypothetical protein EKK48_15100 [Candidatus Melainabacteria bacterium]